VIALIKPMPRRKQAVGQSLSY